MGCYVIGTHLSVYGQANLDAIAEGLSNPPRAAYVPLAI